jgi:hypothetical protein
MRTHRLLLTALIVAGLSATAAAQGNVYGLKTGNVDLLSIGPIEFGPDGILFVADPQAATVYAIATGDARGDASKASHNIENLNRKITEALGGQAQIRDLKAKQQTAEANENLVKSLRKAAAKRQSLDAETAV